MFAAIINHHPMVTFLLIFLGIPVFLLTAVSVCAGAAIFPLALLMGWL